MKEKTQGESHELVLRCSTFGVLSNFGLRISGLHAERAVWLVAALLGLPANAEAHLVNTGFGPFYDGISHLLLSPEELLGVLGLSLLAGMGGAQVARWMLIALPCSWLGGGLIGLQSSGAGSLPLLTAVGLLLMGMLVALDRQWPLAVPVGLACLFGAIQGYFNGSVAAQTRLGLGGLLGIASSVFVLVALFAALTVSTKHRPPWTRVVVRVAGSWVAAIGLLMAGWALR